ncbi:MULTISPECIES: hypothetical protein [unclassified Curtobacterium]|uniref:hypothetical protein n=1 Tax=unclassified Curtobacterium TaxID=257496 RepID=UPI00226B0AF0|nr:MULTISPECIES: hypothetical protein [unclassified Curtobacterium]
MADATRPPHTLVKIELNLGSPAYLAAANQFSEPYCEAWWAALGDALYGRPGWYCELVITDTGTSLLWSFGALGTSLFNIGWEGDADSITLFDYENDRSISFGSSVELNEWLDQNEWRHDDHVRENLAPMLADANWALLQSVEFQIDVTHDDSTWIATVQKLPVTAAFGPSLTEVLSAARAAIVHEFGAPAGLASQIKVSAHFDPAAVAAT